VESSRYVLALEEARRALDHQAEDVHGMRGRSAALVTVGALSAAFLGGLSARDDAESLTAATVVGALSFVGLLAMTVTVLWPRRFHFTQNAQVLVAWVEHGADLAKMHRDLALHMQRHYRTNDQRLLWFTRFYRIGLIFLVIEIVALLIDLRG
jgi:hypothetical protein